MKVEIKYILIIIALLILSFLIGRCTSPVQTKEIVVTIPESSGQSPVIQKPDPLIQVKDSLIYKDSLILTQNPINKDLANEYIKLEDMYSGLELETLRLKAYVNSIQIRKYKVPYENDSIKIVGNIEVQGELNNIQYDWTIKEKRILVDIPEPKKKIGILIGIQAKTNLDFTDEDLFPTAGLQLKNGSLILGSYGIRQKSVQAGYLFKF